MIDSNSLTGANRAGAQHQSYTSIQMLWDDIQQLKKEILALKQNIKTLDQEINELKNQK